MRGQARLDKKSRQTEAAERSTAYGKLSVAEKIARAEAAPGESSKQLRRLNMQK